MRRLSRLGWRFLMIVIIAGAILMIAGPRILAVHAGAVVSIHSCVYP